MELVKLLGFKGFIIFSDLRLLGYKKFIFYFILFFHFYRGGGGVGDRVAIFKCRGYKGTG